MSDPMNDLDLGIGCAPRAPSRPELYTSHPMPSVRCGCGCLGPAQGVSLCSAFDGMMRAVRYQRSAMPDGTVLARLYCPECSQSTAWTAAGPEAIAEEWVRHERFRTLASHLARREKGLRSLAESMHRRLRPPNKPQDT